MKTLYESILDDEDEVMDRIGVVGKREGIKQFIYKNYTIITYNKNEQDLITFNDEDEPYIMGSLTLKNNSLKHLTDGTFRFGGVSESFDCSESNIIDLKGAPRYVGRNFDCGGCDELVSLKGSPEKIGTSFTCYSCPKLKDLIGMTKKFTKPYYSINCSGCKNLQSLKGSPSTIKGPFNCSECPSLTNLKGGPKSVQSMTADYCYNLTDIKDRPRYKFSFSFVGTPAYEEYLKNDRKFTD